MRFYDALQLDPAVLKPQIKAAETLSEKRKLQIALVLRSTLIVAFAILFISSLSKVFGTENTPMCVAMFCILLGIRFVDFGYCIKDSLINLAVVFLLLLVAPVAASLVNPVLAIMIHFGAFLTLLLMTSDKPELGNGGLCGFSYVYLTGNPVTGESFLKRCLLTLLLFLLYSIIFYVKHHAKHTNIRFQEIVKNFDLSNEKSRWQLRMAIGVSLVLTMGSFFHIQRFMWAGFACASLLSTYPYAVDVKKRFFHRMIGVITGSFIFLVIYKITPESYQTLLGPVGGFCLGFAVDYRVKTALNCFGALALAAGLYGIEGAVLLRILNNFLGVLFGYAFILLYRHCVDKHFEDDNQNLGETSAEF